MIEHETARSAATARVKRLAGPALTTRVGVSCAASACRAGAILRRTTPFSSTFGFERGTPIDRYYLHRFLARIASHHRPRARSADRGATPNGSGTIRARRHVRHRAAVRADLSLRLRARRARDPGSAYDCCCCRTRCSTSASSISRWRRPCAWCGRADHPRLGRRCAAADRRRADYWRMSPDGWRESSRGVAGRVHRDRRHGNCLASVAAQLGLAVEELTAAELDVEDPRYPVLTTTGPRRP